MSADLQFKLIIKPKAYYKMLVHVLRFGADDLPKKQWKEVMGTLIGKVENNNPVVYDAVPMTHGGRIEVEWSEEQYAAQSEIDQQIAKEGYFAVGWYHSHPGMTAFLSAADKKNHLFFQTVNPRAVAIVWDHQMLVDGIGFNAFRLNNLAAGVSSDFKPIPIEVEKLNNNEIFKWIADMLNRVHRKDPFIEEKGEMADVFESFDVEQLSAIEVPEKGDPKEMLKAVGTKVSNAMVANLTTIRNMKETISNGLIRLQNWFVQQQRESMGDVEFELQQLKDQIAQLLAKTGAK